MSHLNLKKAANRALFSPAPKNQSYLVEINSAAEIHIYRQTEGRMKSPGLLHSPAPHPHRSAKLPIRRESLKAL